VADITAETARLGCQSFETSHVLVHKECTSLAPDDRCTKKSSNMWHACDIRRYA